MEEREDVPVSEVLMVVWAELLVGEEVAEERRVETEVVQMAVCRADSLEVEAETEMEEDLETGVVVMVSCLEGALVHRTGMFQSIGRLRPGTCPLPRKHQCS